MSYIRFTHTTKVGTVVGVYADVSIKTPLASNAHTASCRDDLEYSVEVDDLLIVNWEGKDVTEEMCNLIPDSVFLREYELQHEEGGFEWEDMQLSDIHTEAESYY